VIRAFFRFLGRVILQLLSYINDGWKGIVAKAEKEDKTAYRIVKDLAVLWGVLVLVSVRLSKYYIMLVGAVVVFVVLAYTDLLHRLFPSAPVIAIQAVQRILETEIAKLVFNPLTWIPFAAIAFLALAAIFGVPGTIEIVLRRALDKRIRGSRKRSLASLGLALLAFSLMFSWYLPFCGNCGWALGFLKIGVFAVVVPTAVLGLAGLALREVWIKIRHHRFAQYVRMMFMLTVCLVLSSLSSRYLPLVFLAIIWGMGLFIGISAKAENEETTWISVISWSLGATSFIVFLVDWMFVASMLEQMFS